MDEREEIRCFGQLWWCSGGLKPSYRHRTVAGLLDKQADQTSLKNPIPVSKMSGIDANQCYLSNAKDVVYSVPRFCYSL